MPTSCSYRMIRRGHAYILLSQSALQNYSADAIKSGLKLVQAMHIQSRSDPIVVQTGITNSSLYYSSAISTPKIPLTFNKFGKIKLENFDFVRLFSSSCLFFHGNNSKNIKSLQISSIPNGCLANLLWSKNCP